MYKTLLSNILLHTTSNTYSLGRRFPLINWLEQKSYGHNYALSEFHSIRHIYFKDSTYNRNHFSHSLFSSLSSTSPIHKWWSRSNTEKNLAEIPQQGPIKNIPSSGSDNPDRKIDKKTFTSTLAFDVFQHATIFYCTKTFEHWTDIFLVHLLTYHSDK